MKNKFSLIVAGLLMFSFSLSAQKFGFIDTDYILKNIPAYTSAQEQLNTAAKVWQEKVDAVSLEAKELYKKYQAEAVYLSKEEKQKREEIILLKEKEVRDLKNEYFGPQGKLFQKREGLIAPIQEEVYNAIRETAEDNGIDLILDKASSQSIVYSSNQHDVSDQVLRRLGYSN